MKPALITSGLLQALLLTYVANKNQSLKELRAAAQEAILKNKANKQKQPYITYINILILIYLIPAIIFAFIYLLKTVYTPNKKLKLSKSFVSLVTISSILATVNHVTAVLCS
jgi:hypothetical protein